MFGPVKIISGLLCLFLSIQVYADTLFVDQQTQKVLVGNKIEFISDTKRQYSIQDFLDSNQTQTFQVNQTSMLRFREHEYNTDVWLKIPIQNISDTTVVLVLSVNNSLINVIEFYNTINGRFLAQNRTGDSLTFDTRAINYRDYIFRVRIEPQKTHTLYMRFDVDGRRLHLPLILYSYDEFISYFSIKEMQLGLLYGVLFCVSIISFYLYYLIKDRSFLFFSIYSFIQGLLHFSNSGYASQLLWPDYPLVTDRAPLILMALTITSGAQFIISFIQKEHFKRWQLISIRSLQALGILIVVGALGNGFVYNITVWSIYRLVIPFYFCMFIIALVFFSSRYKPARVLFLALVLSIGTVAGLTYHEYSSHGNFLTNSFVVYSEMFKCLLLCIALFDRLRIYKEEKEKAQAALIEQLEEMNTYKQKINAELEHTIAIKSKELLEKQTEVQRALIWGEEKERQRVAQELHDGLGSLLSTLRLNAESIDLSGKNLNTQEKMAYQNVIELIDKACTELRSISHNMMPASIQQFGLGDTLYTIINKINTGSSIHFTLDIYGFEKRLEDEIELSVYRIILELTNNIVKHSQAKNATIQLIRYDDSISILVEDDGIGIRNEDLVNKGIGLLSLSTRVESLKGKIIIDSNKNTGTTFNIEIPIAS